VPLIDQAAKALDGLSQREAFTAPDDLVFCTEVGEHVTDDTMRDGFYDALDRAGLGDKRDGDDPIVFHDLRHTFGTRMIAKADIRRVQEWMGHADIQTTMRYLHYAPHAEDAALVAEAFRLEAPAEPAAAVD